MSATKVSILECDGCGKLALNETMPIADLVHMVAKPSHVGEARTLAAAKGWRHTGSGRDLCPDCQSAKRAPHKIHLGLPHFHFRYHRGEN